MATVPRITGPSVEVRAPANTYQSASGATPEAFGLNNAQATIRGGQQLMAAGEKGMDAATRLKFDEDEREVKAADTEFTRRRLLALRGDGTTDNPGFYGSQGQTAIDGYKPTLQAIEQAQRELTDGIKSERAKRMFSDSATKRLLADDEAMRTHVGRETVNVQNATSTARVEAHASEAGLFWNDDQVIANSIGVANGEAEAVARRNGLVDPQVVERMRVENRTKVVQTAVQGALEIDPARAEELYKRYAGDIDGRTANVLGRQVAEKAILTKGQELGDKYFAMIDLRDPNSMVKVLDRVRKELNGKEEKATIEELMTRMREINFASDLSWQNQQRARTARDQRAEDAANAVTAELRDRPLQERLNLLRERLPDELYAIAENKVRAQYGAYRQTETILDQEAEKRAVEWVEQLKNPDELPLADKQRIGLSKLNSFRKDYQRRMSGEPLQNDIDYYNEMRSLGVDELRNVDLAEAHSKLTKPYYDKLAEQVFNARQGKFDQKASADHQAIKTALDALGEGLNPSKPNEDQKRVRAQIVQAIIDELDAERANQPGKAISPEQRDALISKSIARYVSRQETWFGLKVKNTANTEAIAGDAGVSYFARSVRSNAPAAYNVFSQFNLSADASTLLRLAQEPPPSPAERRTAGQVLRGAGIVRPTEVEIRAAVLTNKILAERENKGE